MGEGAVDAAMLEELAAGLRQRQLDIGWAIGTVLCSEVFFSDANISTRVSGPPEYVVGAIRALELCDPPPSTLLLAEWVSRMGQNLFYPPNVGGWAEGRAWLGSRSIIARANFARALVDGRLWYPPCHPILDQLCDRHRGRDRDPSVRETSSSRKNSNNELERCSDWFLRLLWGSAPEDIMRQIVSSAMSTANPFATALVTILSSPEHHLA
jgi:uncharacterized protein (DUF1800 family)